MPVFGPEPNIDMPKLIGLIQKHDRVYKLDGSDRLRIIKSLPDVEARVKELEGLLKELAA